MVCYGTNLYVAWADFNTYGSWCVVGQVILPTKTNPFLISTWQCGTLEVITGGLRKETQAPRIRGQEPQEWPSMKKEVIRTWRPRKKRLLGKQVKHGGDILDKLQYNHFMTLPMIIGTGWRSNTISRPFCKTPKVDRTWFWIVQGL